MLSENCYGFYSNHPSATVIPTTNSTPPCPAKNKVKVSDNICHDDHDADVVCINIKMGIVEGFQSMTVYLFIDSVVTFT